MSIISDLQSRNRLNISSNQRNDNASNSNQHINSKNRNIAMLLSDEKIEEAIEAKIAFLRTNARRTLIAKKNRLRVVASQAPKTIIVESSFVSTKNANTLSIINLINIQSANNNIDKSLTDSNTNNKKVKIKIVSFKVKKLKPKKIKFYFGKFEKKHIY